MNKFLEFIKSGKIMMAAHRGDKDCRPENTIPAFKHAIEVGSDGIETDIHQTKDGVLVMMHDHTIDRTTTGTGKVCELTLAEILQYDASVPTRFGDEYKGTKVPTFEEFLDLVEPYPDLLLNLELKDYPGVEGEEIAFSTADKVVAAIERRGMGDRIMLNCFSGKVLYYIHEKYGDKYPLHGFYPAFIMSHSDEYDLFPILTYACLFNQEQKPDGKLWVPPGTSILRSAEDFRELKEKLHCEPCVCFARDTHYLMKEAIARGVTMFTCNDPERAVQILKDLGYRK